MNTNETQTSQVDLSLSDLTIIRSIVEAASKRGTFEASELYAVGAAYNKLNAFITAAQKSADTTSENVNTEE